MQDDMRLSVFAEKKGKQLIYYPERCIGCGTCVLICPTGVLHLDDVSGYRSSHGAESGYDQVYCRVCSDTPVAAGRLEDITGLFSKKAGS